MDEKKSQDVTQDIASERPSLKLKAGWVGLACLFVFSLSCCAFVLTRRPSHLPSKEDIVSLIEQYAKEEGIEDQLPELKAIATVESNYSAEDVFQSSESLGLPPNSLSTVESVQQGVHYYRTILDRAKELGLDQDAVFQAYNFGIGYLDFVYNNGGRHTAQLAEEFSRQQSNGEIVAYPNPIAINANGGWRYNYGNMFYVDLIHQIL